MLFWVGREGGVWRLPAKVTIDGTMFDGNVIDNRQDRTLRKEKVQVYMYASCAMQR